MSPTKAKKPDDKIAAFASKTGKLAEDGRTIILDDPIPRYGGHALDPIAFGVERRTRATLLGTELMMCKPPGFQPLAELIALGIFALPIGRLDDITRALCLATSDAIAAQLTNGPHFKVEVEGTITSGWLEENNELLDEDDKVVATLHEGDWLARLTT